MTEDKSKIKDETVEAPPEAQDPALSSNAKDAFLANEPVSAPAPVTNAVAPLETGPEPPEEHKHHSYDVKAKDATEEDADFDAEETNRKGGDEVE